MVHIRPASPLWLLIGFIAVVSDTAGAQRVDVPNASFERAENGVPAAWTLTGGEGTRFRGDAAQGAWAARVTGSGAETHYWRSPPLPLEASALYALHFSARMRDRTTGVGVAGPLFANRIYTDFAGDWERHTVYFMTPSNTSPDNGWLRFGHWHTDGSMDYDAVELTRAAAVYSEIADVMLGDGEHMRGNTYTFNATWKNIPINHQRPLVSFRDCYFNQDCFMFGAGGELILKHEVGDRMQRSATLSVPVRYYFSGAAIVEAANGAANWIELAQIEDGRGAVVELPAQLFPSRAIFVRIRAEADAPLGLFFDMGAFGIGSYDYTAQVDGPPVEGVGKTHYVELRSVDEHLDATVLGLGDLRPGGENVIRLRADNHAGKTVDARTVVTVRAESGDSETFPLKRKLAPGENAVELPYAIHRTGDHALDIALGKRDGFNARLEFNVAGLYATGYGAIVPGSSQEVALWWASSGWKIPKDRPLPAAHGKGIVIYMAANEAEAAQLVVRPSRRLEKFSATCTALAGPNGAAIPAEAVEVLRVRYVPVAFPTDTTGVAAPWPDPLPPFRGPIDIPAGENQPLWVRVATPKNLPGGVYRGAVALGADGYAASVPIEVHVYGFSLPDRMTCETAFGLSPGNVFRYHGLTARDQQRLVLSKYLKNMSAHHISPYDPAPLDGFRVIWPDVKSDDPTDIASLDVQFDWTAWDAAMEKAFDKYHFNTYRMPTVGTNLGRGTNPETPTLCGFPKGTPEYKTLFYNYHHGLQEHLRQKGWLDYAYFYWFDEPNPEDYPIVMEGFRMLREAAPDIRRMLTEQVEPELVGGPNLWCPYTRPYNHERAEERRRHGDQFWWYVCTVPKAPYCGLFIDHPATEMRVWLWQTWQRNIEGVLVWETTYWTSPTAYPDRPQNPYEDPMGWVSSGARAKGMRTPWGNGDGRFMYPPEAAADARPAAPVLDGPVDSIRLEMLRDGIEDYEYLAILKRLLAKRGAELSTRKRRKYEALLDVPAGITSDMVTFTKDPAPIESQRHKIATAVESLLSE